MRVRNQGRPQIGDGNRIQTWLDFGTKLGQFLDKKWARIRAKSGSESVPIFGTESVPKMGDEKCTKNGGRILTHFLVGF